LVWWKREERGREERGREERERRESFSTRVFASLTSQ
jgi:hypothetical protein